MILLGANETFYHGILRWDLGFDNPNKAAILLALLLLPLLAVILRARRSWMVWGSATLALPVGYAFVHTFSRGGFVALATAGLLLLAASARHLRADRKRLIPLLVIGLSLAASAILTGFSARMANSVPTRDASIGNRLLIWKTVPRMMVDAPGGWGSGHAGEAFSGWYQPLDRHERYRTLVNSHLTWLTEWGWCGRWLYVTGWLSILGLGLVRWKKRSDALPLALWVCLGIGGFFSSVAEEPVIWILPALATVPLVQTFLAETPTRRGLLSAGASVGSGLLLLLFAVIGHLNPIHDIALHRTVDGERIVVGADEPPAWIVFDDTTMGGPTYGRTLRGFLRTPEGRDRSIGIATQLDAVPKDVRHLILCGAAAGQTAEPLRAFPQLETVRVLSPKDPRKWLSFRKTRPDIQVFCGELSPTCPPEDLPGLKTIPGAGDYLPTWPRLAFTEP